MCYKDLSLGGIFMMHHDSCAPLFDTNQCHSPPHLSTFIHYSKIIPLFFVVHILYVTLYVAFHSLCSFCVALYKVFV
jgi:hypothetical protein